MSKYFLDLCAGVGGFALAARMAGMSFDKTYYSEVDAFAVKIYQKNFPGAVALGDIKEIDYGQLPVGDWVACMGTPCQPFSLAGRRAGADDERNLWPESIRMLRQLRPRFALFENVQGLLTADGGNFFNGLLSGIHQSGYDAEWSVIPASAAGAPHVRKRVWIAAYPQGIGLQAACEENLFAAVGGQEEPREWQALQSVAARNYNLEYREEHEHILTGGDDGLPKELVRDRIKAAGNAIVPQVAALLLRRFKL